MPRIATSRATILDTLICATTLFVGIVFAAALAIFAVGISIPLLIFFLNT